MTKFSEDVEKEVLRILGAKEADRVRRVWATMDGCHNLREYIIRQAVSYVIVGICGCLGTLLVLGFRQYLAG